MIQCNAVKYFILNCYWMFCKMLQMLLYRNPAKCFKQNWTEYISTHSNMVLNFQERIHSFEAVEQMTNEKQKWEHFLMSFSLILLGVCVGRRIQLQFKCISLSSYFAQCFPPQHSQVYVCLCGVPFIFSSDIVNYEKIMLPIETFSWHLSF